MQPTRPTDSDMHDPLQERVELIVHLLKFSDRLFAIMSPDENELKAFSQRLQETSGMHLHYAMVSTVGVLMVEDLAAKLAKAWNIDINTGDSPIKALEQRLGNLIPDPHRAVAVISESDQLPESVLDGFVRLMSRLDAMNDGRVRLVLLGDPGLAAKLKRLDSLKQGGQVYALHLGINKPPAVKPQVEQPGALGAQAATTQNRSEPPAAKVGPTLNVPHYHEDKAPIPGKLLLIGGLGVSLVLAVMLSLFMRKDDKAATRPGPVSIAIHPNPATTGPATPPAVLPGHQLEAGSTAAATQAISPEPAPADVAMDTEKAPDQQEPSEPRPQPAPVISPEQAAETDTPKLPDQTSITESKTVPSTQPVEQAQARPMPRKAEAKPAPAPRREPKPSTSSNNWYASQRPNYYVLQIISLSSAKAVKDYVAKHKLQECRHFVQQHQSKTLYTLTCGLFTSRDAALKAAAKLPEAVRKASPYPRKIEDIRKVIKP